MHTTKQSNELNYQHFELANNPFAGKHAHCMHVKLASYQQMHGMVRRSGLLVRMRMHAKARRDDPINGGTDRSAHICSSDSRIILNQIILIFFEYAKGLHIFVLRSRNSKVIMTHHKHGTLRWGVLMFAIRFALPSIRSL